MRSTFAVLIIAALTAGTSSAQARAVDRFPNEGPRKALCETLVKEVADLVPEMTFHDRIGPRCFFRLPMAVKAGVVVYCAADLAGYDGVEAYGYGRRPPPQFYVWVSRAGSVMGDDAVQLSRLAQCCLDKSFRHKDDGNVFLPEEKGKYVKRDLQRPNGFLAGL